MKKNLQHSIQSRCINNDCHGGFQKSQLALIKSEKLITRIEKWQIDT